MEGGSSGSPRGIKAGLFQLCLCFDFYCFLLLLGTMLISAPRWLCFLPVLHVFLGLCSTVPAKSASQRVSGIGHLVTHISGPCCPSYPACRWLPLAQVLIPALSHVAGQQGHRTHPQLFCLEGTPASCGPCGTTGSLQDSFSF